MRDPLHWVPIKYKLPLTFSVLYVVAFGIGGYLVTRDTRQALEERIRGELENRALLAKQVVDSGSDLIRRRIEDFASDGFIRVQVEALVAAEGRAERGEFEEPLRRHLSENKLPLVPFFVDAAVTDIEGRPFLRVTDSYPDVSLAVVDTTTFGGVLPPDSRREFRACIVTTPLRSLHGGQRIGQLQILLDLDHWLEAIASETTMDGSLEAHHRSDLVLRDSAGHSLPIARSPRSQTTDGDEERAVIRHELALGVPGWTLGVATDQQAAMAPVRTLTKRFFGIGTALLAISLAFLFFPAHFLLRPLLQLQHAAQRMTAGDESVRVADESSNDEIGDLSRAFNVMARSVEERSQRLKDSAQKLERQQALLRFERDRLDVLVRSMQDGLFIMNNSGDVTFSNAAGHALIDRLKKAGSLRECLLCAEVKGEDPDCLGCLAGANSLPGSCMVRADERVYEVHVTPLPTRVGHPPEGVYVSRDVTERIEASQRQVHQERIHVVGELAAVVAHEVNNPLAAIIMFSQMISDALEDGADFEGSADLKKQADVILRNADVCRRTVSNLLEMSAFPASDIGELVVEDLLTDVAEFLRPLIERKMQRFEIDTPDQSIVLRGDELQLRQVLVNLVMNAVQAAGDTPGQVLVRASQHVDRVTIEVEDDGPGVPEGIRARVFDPFFSTKRPGTGTGLGLSTSKRIAEAHGGRLLLSVSEPGKTVFSLELPRNTKEPLRTESLGTVEVRALTNEKPTTVG